MNEPKLVQIPIDGILDLHQFSPGEIKNLVVDYLVECRTRGICQVRIIHGKGTGVQREIVHATLKKISDVISFRLADETGGGWGATVVILKPDEPDR